MWTLIYPNVSVMTSRVCNTTGFELFIQIHVHLMGCDVCRLIASVELMNCDILQLQHLHKGSAHFVCYCSLN